MRKQPKDYRWVHKKVKVSKATETVLTAYVYIALTLLIAGLLYAVKMMIIY